jgi:hypothetical protein
MRAATSAKGERHVRGGRRQKYKQQIQPRAQSKRAAVLVDLAGARERRGGDVVDQTEAPFLLSYHHSRGASSRGIHFVNK